MSLRPCHAACAVPLILLAGCDGVPQAPLEPRVAALAGTAGEATPSPLASVALGSSTLEFWPFTGADFGHTPLDPINLIFFGQSDPRALRAALMMLDGDRTAFGLPDVFPFNCTWKDAIGGMQTAYSTGAGWAGSAIQLECGDFGPIRFHLRLFNAGDWTLANAHFEVLIPATTEHQVLSWELAEQLVTVDLLRSGLLDAGVPLFATGTINPSPFHEIPAVIYNGLPLELRGVIGGPSGDVSGPVPMATDGRATVFNVVVEIAGEAVVARQDFVIRFDQVIPKPFCVPGPGAFLYVVGPVRLRQHVLLTQAGDFVSQFHAVGHLDLTPIDLSTGAPTSVGATYRAQVVEHHKGIVTDEVTLASSLQLQAELPPQGDVRGRLAVQLNVGPGGSNRYSLEVRCSP